MSNIGNELVAAARHRLDQPFAHHFKPVDRCQHGAASQPDCLTRGLGGPYDCSGLVVASMCDVLGIAHNNWPLHMRHLVQIELLLYGKEPWILPRAGDIAIRYDREGTQHPAGHTGIMTIEGSLIHASGITYRVEEEPPPPTARVERLPATRLADYVLATLASGK